jgi:hypothetical protein
MQHFDDYRRKIYIIVILIFFLIYFKLYSKSDDDKRKQLLSSGSVYSPNTCLPFSSITSSIRLKRKESDISLYHSSFVFVEFIMNHVHDHAAMVDNTTTLMNHDHHLMDHTSETTAMAGGHGLHMKDMMMMAVSVNFNIKQNEN